MIACYPQGRSHMTHNEKYAVIGGTGLCKLPGVISERREAVTTPYGDPSADLTIGSFRGQPIIFLARHGDRHTIPPHRINYRANIQALKQAGVTRIIAVAAVGGIHQHAVPAAIVIPDQLIDYSYGRNHTFSDGGQDHVTHIDFTEPYTPALRVALLQAGNSAGLNIIDGGVYGCTQGPRLETPAEIARMARDGCTLVGMTGMPEAALAREAGIAYAGVAVVANWAAGITDAEITMPEIHANLEQGMADVGRLFSAFFDAAT
jgi:5'-methylthioinosine phosphorylase